MAVYGRGAGQQLIILSSGDLCLRAELENVGQARCDSHALGTHVALAPRLAGAAFVSAPRAAVPIRLSGSDMLDNHVTLVGLAPGSAGAAHVFALRAALSIRLSGR